MNTTRKTKASSVDRLKVGEVCKAGYGAYMVETEFNGWTLEKGQPYANFTDVDDGLKWQAYIFENKICLGSSAKPLKILRFV